ncbi:hypothetical protein REPUB_Repub11eG0165100 [Reevesia pubescens]
MPSHRFSGSLSAPSVYVTIDTGNHFVNHTLDGFLKIGTVAVTRVVAEDTFKAIDKGKLSKDSLEHSLHVFDIIFFSFSWEMLLLQIKKMCKEGAYWGTVAGVYVGMEYGVERIRGRRDWKNAMIGGAITGALVSAASKNNKDKIVADALTGGAVATASVVLNYLS